MTTQKPDPSVPVEPEVIELPPLQRAQQCLQFANACLVEKSAIARNLSRGYVQKAMEYLHAAHEAQTTNRQDADNLLMQVPRDEDGRLQSLAVHDLVARLVARANKAEGAQAQLQQENDLLTGERDAANGAAAKWRDELAAAKAENERLTRVGQMCGAAADERTAELLDAEAALSRVQQENRAIIRKHAVKMAPELCDEQPAYRCQECQLSWRGARDAHPIGEGCPVEAALRPASSEESQ